MIPATTYDGLAKELIHSLKFARAQAAAQDIAELLVGRLPVALRHPQVITYIPTAPSRIRSRGYDQARLIALQAGRRLQLPCLPLLGRSGNQRQLGQGRTVRQRQLADAFYALHPSHVADRNVLLIDDVLTTGSTCEAAASVLRAAGARHVAVAVFAVA